MREHERRARVMDVGWGERQDDAVVGERQAAQAAGMGVEVAAGRAQSILDRPVDRIRVDAGEGLACSTTSGRPPHPWSALTARRQSPGARPSA